MIIEEALHWIVQIVEALGYPGIFILSALESTFMPIPCEATLIPAGYLVHQGKMDGALVFLLSVSGALTGSLLNYWFARWCGRYVLVRYGRWFLMNEERLAYVESYFNAHGPISIFLARLLFGVRHFISFPAGLAKMDQVKFSIYTVAGAGLYSGLLIWVGYLIGNNQALLATLLPQIKIGSVLAVALIGGVYWVWQRRKTARV